MEEISIFHELTISTLVQFLMVFIIILSLFLFREKVGDFIDFIFSWALLIGLIVSACLLYLLKVICDKIRKFISYYFKMEKELITGDIVEIIEDEYLPLSYPSGAIDGIFLPGFFIPINIYLVKIKKNDGQIISINFDLNKSSFERMNFIVGKKIECLPCNKYRYEDLYYYENVACAL